MTKGQTETAPNLGDSLHHKLSDITRRVLALRRAAIKERRADSHFVWRIIKTQKLVAELFREWDRCKRDAQSLETPNVNAKDG
ncbi:MAG: hypothetical protein ABIH03_06190 [Pseudomonadota bacterium]